MKNRKGFTLIELMIVIAIIGILAAMAVPNFKKARQSAREKACYSNIRVIQGAVEMYNMDHSAMAKSLSDLMDEDGTKPKGDFTSYMKAVAKPEGSCKYTSEGGEKEELGVFCDYHGDTDGSLNKPGKLKEKAN